MAHPQETKEAVRRKYIFGQMALEAAAAVHAVSINTARSWKYAAKEQGDDWDKLRAAHLMAGGGLEETARTILSGFLLQYQTTIEELNQNPDISTTDKVQALSSLADSYNKTVAASRRVLPETGTLATALQVLEMLMEFVQQKHPKHLAAFVEVLEPFGEAVQKRLG